MNDTYLCICFPGIFVFCHHLSMTSTSRQIPHHMGDYLLVASSFVRHHMCEHNIKSAHLHHKDRYTGLPLHSSSYKTVVQAHMGCIISGLLALAVSSSDSSPCSAFRAPGSKRAVGCPMPAKFLL